MYIGICECVEGELGRSQEEGKEGPSHCQQWREGREDSCIWISEEEKGFHTLTDSIAVTLILCEIYAHHSCLKQTLEDAISIAKVRRIIDPWRE